VVVGWWWWWWWLGVRGEGRELRGVHCAGTPLVASVDTTRPAAPHHRNPTQPPQLTHTHLRARKRLPLVPQQRADQRLLQHLQVALPQDHLQRVGHVLALVLHRVDLAQREGVGGDLWRIEGGRGAAVRWVGQGGVGQERVSEGTSTRSNTRCPSSTSGPPHPQTNQAHLAKGVEGAAPPVVDVLEHRHAAQLRRQHQGGEPAVVPGGLIGCALRSGLVVWGCVFLAL